MRGLLSECKVLTHRVHSVTQSECSTPLKTKYEHAPTWILTWILGVVSKQLRLLHGRVGDSTTSVNSMSPQMSELVEDAVASCCGDIVGQFWLIRNELQKIVDLKFEFFNFNTFDVPQIFWQRIVQTRP